ncbi:hypothetical protein QE250_12560 [Chromatiaceae bacterium AAb-1]|jgi:hypothetical protein|nr:hypothetical protein [Chromatiaceae bacterium AAb-1]
MTEIFYAVLIVLINLVAWWGYRKLCILQSPVQIQAEVEAEMQRRAHELLVRRDKIEAGAVKENTAVADEQWKDDLAMYMEEFEVKSRLRARKHFSVIE